MQTLASAILSGRVDLVRDLVQNPRMGRGIGVNRTFANGQVPLVLASTVGNVDIVKVLLDAGAKPLMRWDGDTALHAACQVCGGMYHIVYV